MTRPAAVTAGPYAPPAPAGRPAVTSADGSPLHVEIHGPSGAPAVVLSHGWTCSTAFWAAQVRALSDDHRVIVYDQRGHGRTPAKGGCDTRVLADDLEAVLRATLAPGERAVVVGHSMGGMAVLAAAARPAMREHAAGALLCSTGSARLVEAATLVPLPAGRARSLLTRAALTTRAPLGPVTPVSRAVLKYATMGPGSTPAMVEACARIVHACPRRARLDWSRMLHRLDLDREAGELRMPTEVLVGTADRLTPPTLARALVARLPDCLGLVEVPGIGHMTPVEAPWLVTDRIRALVAARIPASRAATGASASPSAAEATEGDDAIEVSEDCGGLRPGASRPGATGAPRRPGGADRSAGSVSRSEGAS
ncbi:alpha/beta hydrolase [Streptomyces sp. HSG2]|uniref:alpha/beta fold hydrolase n=1 Tax=Streptomyces sp. HSG2 TaxID=2797167 RepID=UPI001908EE46|nr:alpha/beta hydrolase [Streptomyces sp. HSG2]